MDDSTRNSRDEMSTPLKDRTSSTSFNEQLTLVYYEKLSKGGLGHRIHGNVMSESTLEVRTHLFPKGGSRQTKNLVVGLGDSTP